MKWSLFTALAFLPVSKAIAEIGVTTSLLCCLFSRGMDLKNWRRLPSSPVPYFIFLGAVALSLVQIPSEHLLTGLRGVLKWVEYAALGIVSAHLFQNSPADRKKLCLLFLISMTVISFNGFYQLATGVDFLRHKALDPGRIIRMKSSLGSPNILAAFYLFALPLACEFFLKSKSWSKERAGYLALSLLFFVSLILTFSRGAFFGMLLAVFLYLVLSKKWKTCVLLIAALSLLLFSFKPFYQNYFASLNPRDITIVERLDSWKVAGKMIKAHPLLGNGVNQYHRLLSVYDPALQGPKHYAHNSYLQMWGETGLLGLGTFLIALACGFLGVTRRVRARTEDSPLATALGVGITALLIKGFFDNDLYVLETSVLFWLFWGLYLAMGSADDFTASRSASDLGI